MPNAGYYYKINEIAGLYGLHADTLRYYEEQGLLSPARGENGYRMYGIQDICALNIIQNLRSLDIPISRIREYMQGRTVESTLELLSQEVDIIDSQISRLTALRADVIRRRQRIAETRSLIPRLPEIISCPARPCYTLSEGVVLDSGIDLQLKKLEQRHAEKLRIVGHRQMGAMLDSGWYQKGVHNRFSSVFFLAEEGEDANQVIEAGLYASVIYGGDYSGITDALAMLDAHISGCRCEKTGAPMELYHIDVHDSRHHREFLTEVQIPVRKLCG